MLEILREVLFSNMLKVVEDRSCLKLDELVTRDQRIKFITNPTAILCIKGALKTGYLF